MAKKKKGIADKVRLSKIKTSSTRKLEKIRSNPFEVKINKQKHNILGRKTKHDKGLPGVSRSKANQKRKDTILKEYKHRNKTNAIKDGRLGADDDEMTLEEKMLQRFALERKKTHEKMSQFNLNDEEELTHLGQSLSTMDRFDDAIDSDGEDDGIGGTMSGEYVEHAHFGGGMFTKKNEDNKTGPKSRKDVIQEIIVKSKQAKFEKQAAKEKSVELNNKLEDSWAEFQQLLRPSLRTPQEKQLARERPKLDDYDMAVRQMVFEKKAAPVEKKKTEEDVKAEEEAKRKKLEEERNLRMQADYDGKLSRPKHQSADALEDEFIVKKEDVGILSYPMVEEINDEDIEEEEEEEGEDLEGSDEEDEADMESETADQGIVDDGDSLDTEEQEDESDDYSDIDSGNEDDEDVQSLEEVQDEEELENKSEEVKVVTEAKFPSSYSEFAGLISMESGEVDSSASKVTEKLRKDNAPAAGKGNKAKMIELFAYVWEHCCKMASLSPPNMAVISSLSRHLYELCAINLDSCSQCVCERLKRSYHSCFLSRKTLRPKWPSFEMLIQFKMIKILYCTSDFKHSVVTPAMLFMCNVLSNCRVATIRDIARGLFLCTLVYEYVCYSKRFVPECLNFLAFVLATALKKDKMCIQDLPPIVAVHLNKLNYNMLLLKKKTTFDENAKPDLVKLLDDNSPEESFDAFKGQLTMATLKLVEKFALLYSELPAYDEVFTPLINICKLLEETKGINTKVVKKVKNVTAIINANCHKPRKPISFGVEKPVPLRLFDPKIENIGEPFEKPSKKLSSELREKQKLLHKRRSEMKGAMREIRKDSKFIARQQQKEQEEMDAERAAKVKRLYGLLSNQEGEIRQIKRSKYKLDI